VSVPLNVTRITGAIHEDEYTFLKISRSVLLRMTSFTHKLYRKTKHTFYIHLFSENRAVYDIEWKNIVEPDRPQMTIRCMPIAYWIPKSTKTHTQNMQYLLLFPSNNGCTNMPKRYVIVHCLSCYITLIYKENTSFQP
jgi:hypothetical protein